MTGAEAMLQLQDVDLLCAELSSPSNVARLRRAGLPAPAVGSLARTRERLLASVDRRWMTHYVRAQARYGRAVTVVRDRICLGCFITLPTSAAPSGDEVLTLCESCGRILYWG